MQQSGAQLLAFAHRPRTHRTVIFAALGIRQIRQAERIDDGRFARKRIGCDNVVKQRPTDDTFAGRPDVMDATDFRADRFFRFSRRSGFCQRNLRKLD